MIIAMLEVEKAEDEVELVFGPYNVAWITRKSH